MELRHLRYFVAVAQERHFGRAAERLHVTQSTLSTQVQALEREVGGPLLRRTSRRVELTEAGELLLTHARFTLAHAAHSLHVARQSIQGKTGVVRIGFSGVAVLQGHLIADMHAFHQANPATELTLTELPPAAQVTAVRDGTLDVGYCPRLGLGDTEGLALRPRAAATPLSVALRHDHELAAASALSVADLAHWDLVIYATKEEEAQVLAQLGPETDRPRSRVHTVTGTLAALAFAAAGTGVAVVPAAVKRIDLPDITYRRLTMTPGPDLLIISRADELSGPVRAFLGHDWKAAPQPLLET
jgi:DNA-binding transcriptional LysR family regulator